MKNRLFANRQEETQEEVEDDEIEDMLDEGYEVGFDFALLNPIRLNENEVRLVERNGNYLISESDFESVIFNYDNKYSGQEIINIIAEAHNITPSDIVVMISEGRIGDTGLYVKKALSNSINNTGEEISVAIERLKGKLARLNYQSMYVPRASEKYLSIQKKIKETKEAIKVLLVYQNKGKEK